MFIYMHNRGNVECPCHTAISCLSNIAYRGQIHVPQVRYCLHANCVCVWGEVINSEIVTTQLCLVAQ